MASTTTASRKTLTLPKSAANTRASMKAGEKAPAAPRATKAERAIETVLVDTLHSASGFHRDALTIELSVGLFMYMQKADAEKVTLDAKRALTGIYAKAGYACETPAGEDYKTVNRRVNVTSDLFVKVGARDALMDLTEGMKPDEAIEKIKELVKSLKFDGINAVLAYCGKATTVKRPRHQNAPGAGGTGATGGDGSQGGGNTGPSGGTPGGTPGGGEGMSDTDRMVAEAASRNMPREQGVRERAEDKLPPGRIVTSGNFRVAIPLGASFEDIIAVANGLVVFARTFLAPSPAAANAAHEVVAAAKSVRETA